MLKKRLLIVVLVILMSIIIFLIYLAFQTNEHNTIQVKDSVNEISLDATQKNNTIFHTQPSILSNRYNGFNSPKAINAIAAIENEYFTNVKKTFSKYYGTIWQTNAKNRYRVGDTINEFERYKIQAQQNDIKVDSMHCTIYAVKGLEAGLGVERFEILEKYHKKIWEEREHAGWSIAYILTTYFNWTAFLVISKDSEEYSSASNNFKKKRKYDVWKQPDIPIQKMFVIENDQKQIDSLLLQNEFGWGFSKQGWHTWITRFDIVKECNWEAAPSWEYQKEWEKPLFISTKFRKYKDYASHIIVFPPKIEQ